MNGWPWLVGALLAMAGALLAGRPAWSALQARRRRDLNAERYLAWRGRADRNPVAAGPSRSERWRLSIALALALIAVLCVAAFFGSR